MAQKLGLGLGLESHPHTLGKIYSGRDGDEREKERERERGRLWCNDDLIVHEHGGVASSIGQLGEQWVASPALRVQASHLYPFRSWFCKHRVKKVCT
jgi:hypothetical protein